MGTTPPDGHPDDPTEVRVMRASAESNITVDGEPTSAGLLDLGLASSGTRMMHPSQWNMPSPERLSKVLPQFEVHRLIGHGGMGSVYKATQRSLDRVVAIKLLPLELARNEEFEARFQREARMLARLQHPGIVAIFDTGRTNEGQLYFSMEYVDGTDLHRVLYGSGITPAQALDIMAQLCEALQYAHSQGVIHRDIKPANVMMTRDGRAKLADFGLATPSAEQSCQLTGSHVFLGTLDYVSPEQAQGKAGERSEIYALGVMFYELLAKQTPKGAWKPVSTTRPDVDPRVDAIVTRALEPDPAERYQSPSEMGCELRKLERTDVSTVPPEVVPEEPPVQSATPATDGPFPAPSEKDTKRADPAELENPPSGTVVVDRLFQVTSPYPPHANLILPLRHWKPGERIICPATGRLFVLPASLPEPVIAAAVAGRPGWVRSPYAPSVDVQVPSSLWQPGEQFTCPISGLPLFLSETLPLLEGKLVAQKAGLVLSPFATKTVTVPVSKESWRAGATVVCPATEREFTLPASLPPWPPTAPKSRSRVLGGSVAVAVACAAVIFHYGTKDDSRREQPAPRQMTPPESGIIDDFAGKWLEIARNVERGAGADHKFARNAYLEAARRGSIEAREWLWEHVVAEVVPGGLGRVKHPFDESQGTIQVPNRDWAPGRRVTLDLPQLYFSLPKALEPKIALSPYVPPRGGEAGLVWSPYTDPTVRVSVERSRWYPGSLIECPSSGWEFILPSDEEFPLLEGTINLEEVKSQSKPLVSSPFTNVAVEVRWDDWKGGVRVNDPNDDKKRPFSMPESVVDPELKVVAMKIDKDGGIVTSPYTGKELPVAWTEWIKEQELKVPDPELKEKGVTVSMIVPSKRPALIATFDPADPTNITMPGGRKIKLSGLDLKEGKFSDWEGHWVALPSDPRVLATVVAPNKVVNPYTGAEEMISDAEWKPENEIHWQGLGNMWTYVLPASLVPEKRESGQEPPVPDAMAKDFVSPGNSIFFKYNSRTGVWSSGSQPRSPNPEVFARDLTLKLQSSGKIPKTHRAQVRSDGSIIITP